MLMDEHNMFEKGDKTGMASVPTLSSEDAANVMNVLNSAGVKKIGMALALLIILLIISHFLVKLFRRMLERSKLVSKTLHTLLICIVRYTLILLSVMLAANTVGIPITTFVAVFSIVGIAVTLALQGVLSSVAGCLIIVSGHQFAVGDFIETSSGSGTVADISLLYTKLAAPNGTFIYLPNSSLYTAAVTNVTSNGKRRVMQVYTAAYQHTPEEVRAALQEALAGIPAVLQDPAPNIVVDSYARTYVNYKVFCWTATADYWPTIHRLNELVYASFARHQIQWADPKVAVVTTD